MFTTPLLPIPPPLNSLLPVLGQSTVELSHQQQLHQAQARRKPTNRLNTSLAILSNDERLIASRKLAIAMYGYSWLKPAGCGKTMLGRREEELEREEVERQLREVELQERMAMEQEEQERRDELRRQAEGGEVEDIGERDLDDEVPEADAEEARGSEDGDVDEEEEEDMEGDLDDEIPDAAADGQESSWVYDTRREPDTDSEGALSDTGHVHSDIDPSHAHLRSPRNANSRWQSSRYNAARDDPAATEAMVNAMLDEDELGEYEHRHDLDSDIPDPDADLDMDVDMDANLSDEVPAASDEEQDPGWEHTDSELEESEMDISLLPPHPNSSSRNPGTTHEEMRRVSGNRMLPPPLPSSTSQSRSQQPQQHLPPRPPPRTAPRRNLRAMIQTPGTADEVSALIGTGSTAAMNTGRPAAPDTEDSVDQPRSPNRRSWLNPAGARRNLFGGFRGGSSTTNTTASASVTRNGNSDVHNQAQPRTTIHQLRTAVSAVSSGGLFTPSPRQPVDSDDEDEHTNQEPRSRTRSGRLLGGLHAARRGRWPRGAGET